MRFSAQEYPLRGYSGLNLAIRQGRQCLRENRRKETADLSTTVEMTNLFGEAKYRFQAMSRAITSILRISPSPAHVFSQLGKCTGDDLRPILEFRNSLVPVRSPASEG